MDIKGDYFSDINNLIPPMKQQFKALNINNVPDITKIIALQQNRVKTIKEMAEESVYFVNLVSQV